MITPEKSAIIDYICSSRSNLDIGISITESKDILLLHVVNKFINKLKNLFVEKLKIKFSPSNVNSIDHIIVVNDYENARVVPNQKSWPGVNFTTKEWHKFKYALRLEPQREGLENFVIGIWIGENKNNPLTKNVIEDLNNSIGKGLKSDYWPWYYHLKQFENWTDKNTLLDFYFGTEAVEMYVEKLLKIYDITSPSFNSRCSKNCGE